MALKHQKIRYVDVAEGLGLSESSIKRLFSKGDMSLSRLQDICDLVGMDLGELAQQAIENKRLVNTLTYEQEVLLTEDTKLLLLAYLLAAGWAYGEIVQAYSYTESEAGQMLSVLDQMRVIERLADNGVRLRLARDFQWRKNGPVNRFFNQQVQAAFFESGFQKAGSLRLSNNGFVSRATLDVCHHKMENLQRDLDELMKEDAKMDKRQLIPITHITAIRPWIYPAFQQFAR